MQQFGLAVVAAATGHWRPEVAALDRHGGDWKTLSRLRRSFPGWQSVDAGRGLPVAAATGAKPNRKGNQRFRSR